MLLFISLVIYRLGLCSAEEARHDKCLAQQWVLEE
jgi:hypothetical protein